MGSSILAFRTRAKLACVPVLLCVAFSGGSATAQQAPADPLRHVAGPWDVKLGLDGAVQAVGAWNSWWNLAATAAPKAGFQADRNWGEAWLKPGIRVNYTASDQMTFYGGLAGIASGTTGKDVFLAGDTGRVLLEDAFAGLRWTAAPGVVLDLSAGQQDYTAGTGMLVHLGGGNGFERGALLLSPHTAWQMTAIARLKAGSISVEGFYLDPNELKSSDSHTRLAGASAQVDLGKNQFAGLSYINVLSSEYPSMQAPLTLIPNGREGMSTLNGYIRWEPLPSVPGLWISGELAHQWNDRIDQSAWAGQGEIGYTATKLPFMPTFSYAYRYFSGDDPGTARNERFDPLYYNGSPTLWATGGNASMAFYNSNVLAHRFGIDLVLSQQDFLKFRYWYVDAAELNSPIQFGQGTRLVLGSGFPTLLVGVQKPHLSDDLYMEYTRILTANLFLTSGVALSLPGDGLSGIANGNVQNWWGAYTNLTWKY